MHLGHLSAEEAERQAVRAVATASRVLYDLHRGPMIRPRLFRFPGEHHRLYLAMHHLSFDGVTMARIVLGELVALYDAFAKGLPSPLPDAPTRYVDYARWEQDWIGRPVTIGMFRDAWIGDSREACEKVWLPHALAVHRLYFNVGVYLEEFEPWVSQVRSREDFTASVVAPGRLLYGSGADLRAEIADWRDRTGLEYLALRMRQPGGPGHEATLTALARFGEEVIGPMQEGMS